MCTARGTSSLQCRYKFGESLLQTLWQTDPTPIGTKLAMSFWTVVALLLTTACPWIFTTIYGFCTTATIPASAVLALVGYDTQAVATALAGTALVTVGVVAVDSAGVLHWPASWKVNDKPMRLTYSDMFAEPCHTDNFVRHRGNARHLSAPLFALFNHIYYYYGVFSDHRCVLGYKYRKILGMLLDLVQLMKLCVKM